MLLPVVCSCLCYAPTCGMLLPVLCSYLWYAPACDILLPVECSRLWYAPTCGMLLPVVCSCLWYAATCVMILPYLHLIRITIYFFFSIQQQTQRSIICISVSACLLCLVLYCFFSICEVQFLTKVNVASFF
jgi:hypothetical protein